MKQVITTICVIAIVVILEYVFLPEAKPDTLPQTDVELLKQQNEQLQEDLFYTARHVDSLEYEISRRDTLEKEMKKDLAVHKARLMDSTAKIKQLAREVLALRSEDSKDSLCDELAQKALFLTDLYHEYSNKYDSLLALTDSSWSAFVAVNMELRKSNEALLLAYKSVYDKYIALLSDRSLDKSLRRQKLKTKIVGILGIIGTGAALLK